MIGDVACDTPDGKRALKSMTKPLISVVMPVFNGSRYLETAINSILTQTLDDFEVIAVNDGSTDDSQNILQRIAQADPRVRIISQQNQGVTKSLNTGIWEAKGAYIARMDCDDLCTPTRFADQVEFLTHHPRVVAVGGEVEIVDPDGSPLIRLRTFYQHESIDTENLAGRTAVNHPAVMMRTEAVKQVGGYDPSFRYAQDLDLWLKLAEVGELANLNSLVLQYRLHHESIGASKRNMQVECINRAITDACTRRSLDVQKAGRRVSALKSQTPASNHRTWGWWALNSGHVATARKHAQISLIKAPLDKEAWRLFYCACRGR